MRNNQPVNDEEYVLPDGEVIVTRTDLKGVITYANDAFLASCQFSRDELIGQPHNIVRHPDMPPDAFADLWQCIRGGRPWTALVKNRRKHGGYYWVNAYVTPVIERGHVVAYMSVRTKPTRDQIGAAQALYRRMWEDRRIRLHDGRIVHRGARGVVQRLRGLSFAARCVLSTLTFGSMFAGVAAAALVLPAQAQLPVLLALGAGGLAASAVFGWWSITQLGGPLDSAISVASRVTAGDVSLVFPSNGDPEIVRLCAMLDQMNAKLVGVLKDVHASGRTVQEAATGIAAGNRDLSSRTELQAAALEETAASMEQLTSTVRQNADNARQASELASGASGVAVRGGEAVAKVVDTMNAINESSRRIGDIIGAIDAIAFQTNILALNAAVEAARAGEQGKGFAVVAAEVRQLAQRSATAAREIKSLIEASVATVDEGSRLVDAAGRTMGEIVTSVQRVTDIISEISTASQEQSRGIEQVNQAVTHMDQTTQHNATLVEEVAASTRSLAGQVVSLSDALAAFQLGGAESIAARDAQRVAAVRQERRARREALSAPRSAAAVEG